MGTNRQVEIFEVGKEQLWRWCGHMGRCCVVEGRVVLNDRFSVMDGVSLAKGRYVLVCVCVRFGGQLGGWLVCDSFRSRRKAEAAYLGSVEHVEWSMTRYPRAVAYCEHFEVWHIVDDAELWGTWQALVDAEREEREALVQLREAGEDCEVVEFSDMREACDYVEAALGERASDYDVEAIARDVTVWESRPSVLVLRRSGDAFWSACWNHLLAVLA